MSYAYIVTLHHSTLPPSQCQQAEMQYRQALECPLRGADGVQQTWRAWQEAEHKQGSLSEETWMVARQWLIVTDRARQSVLQGAADITDAYFEV